MHADLWGLVFRFALRLDLLDYPCLDDLCNFALVERSAGAAVARLVKPELRLRVRVHKLFDFQAPTKTQVNTLFPRFADTLSAGSLGLSLAQVSLQVSQSPDGPAWVSWAEARPERIQYRKRKHEECDLARAQRRKYLEAELAARGLPYVRSSSSVMAFCRGKSKTPEAVFKAMAQVKADQDLVAFVSARDRRFSSQSRLDDLARLAQRHSVALPKDLPLEPRSPAWLLAALWLRQASPLWASNLEAKLVLRVGKVLTQRGDPDSLDLDLETSIWLKAARGLITRLTNSIARRS
jgi:hypothetical protein